MLFRGLFPAIGENPRCRRVQAARGVVALNRSRGGSTAASGAKAERLPLFLFLTELVR